MRIIHEPRLQVDSERGHSAEQLRDELIKTFEQVPVHVRRSLTWDQGMEMSRHHEISDALSMPVFSCEPHSPWQRGTNENTNGLLGEYFPKGTELAGHSREDLERVVAEFNDRPRKTLQSETPAAGRPRVQSAKRVASGWTSAALCMSASPTPRGSASPAVQATMATTKQPATRK